MTPSEIEKGFKEVWKLFAESDRKAEKMRDELNEHFKETDKRIKETNRQLKETDKKLEKLIGRWSLFVEGLVLPAAIRLFKERGIIINSLHEHVKVSHNGKEGMEIDILGVNGEYAVLIEVKSTLGVRDVNEHIKRVKKFREYFPEYKDRKVIGAVAGIILRENADKYAYKKGLFVIAQRGDTVKILNDESFKPTEW